MITVILYSYSTLVLTHLFLFGLYFQHNLISFFVVVSFDCFVCRRYEDLSWTVQITKFHNNS